MKPRRLARVTAFEALFEVDTVQHNPTLALYHRLTEVEMDAETEAFCRALVTGVVEHLQLLNDIIQRIAPEWPIEQMACVDRNILRLAAYEVLFYHDTPSKVAINEAVELAKRYGSDSSSRFVNGVLGTLVSQRHQLGISIEPSKGAA